MKPESSTDRERIVTRRTVLKGAAATAVAATVPTTVSADDGEGLPNSVFTRVRMTGATLRGRVSGMFQRRFEERSDAEEAALEAKEEFNPNRAEWADYLNEHVETDGQEVMKLQFEPKPDEDEHTIYLVGDYDADSDQYTELELVDETEREIDETARLESIAADNTADEIRTGYEEFVQPGKEPDDSHLAYLAGRYYFGTDYVSSTLLGDDL